MYIKKIDIDKYRHLNNVSMGPFSPPDRKSELIVLAGPNGSGKTSILELVSKALSQTYSLTYTMNRSQPTSSFEVQLGLFPDEIELIRQNSSSSENEIKAVEYITNYGSYCRSFNYPDGQYASAQTLHNSIHNLVNRVLKNAYKKPMGFFLGSDRVYLKESYNANSNIFRYFEIMKWENIWNYAFQTANAQYKDMFSFLVTWRYHYIRRLGQYYQQLEENPDAELDKPINEYGNILKKVFPEYSFTDKEENTPSDLFIKISSGEILPFCDLSSGEKEVFFTLCFFQRHKVEDTVIIIDEPELHLHPSLVRLLIRTMQDIKPRNQIWLATHNSEVFDEAGRDHVWFIKRTDDNTSAEIKQSIDEEEVIQNLRDFFGYNGYIGLARKMIFLEGRNSSADRKIFGILFSQYTKDIKFIPSSGCTGVERISNAILSLLEANLGYCEFFLIRDRDYMTTEMIETQKARFKDKMIVLERHEIENYLINFEIISKVLNEIHSKSTTPHQVSIDMLNIARKIAGREIRDMIGFRINYIYRPLYIFSEKILQNEIFITHENDWDREMLDKLNKDLGNNFHDTSNEIVKCLESINFNNFFNSCKEEVDISLKNNGWITLFPGKELLIEFSKSQGIGKSPTLIN